MKELYAGRKVTGIFQPHLYTRTRDFAADFAASLSLLDELILLDIYPAREEPIPGVTSQIIFDAVTIADKRLIRKEELLDVVAAEAGKLEVVLMVGAGNIELLVDPVKQILDKKRINRDPYRIHNRCNTVVLLHRVCLLLLSGKQAEGVVP